MEKSNDLHILIAVVVILGFFSIIYFRNMRIENEHEIKVSDKFDKWSPKKIKAFAKYKRAQLQPKSNSIKGIIKRLIKIMLF